MKPLPHRYDVQLKGGPGGHAHLSSLGRPDLPTAPPLEFDGPGDAWSPEHLLLSAVASCFLFTFRAVARAAHIEFADLTIHADGTVDRQAGVTMFTNILLRPRLVVRPGTNRETLAQVLAKTEKACLVSASLKTPVHFEADVVERAVAA